MPAAGRFAAAVEVGSRGGSLLVSPQGLLFFPPPVLPLSGRLPLTSGVCIAAPHIAARQLLPTTGWRPPGCSPLRPSSRPPCRWVRVAVCGAPVPAVELHGRLAMGSLGAPLTTLPTLAPGYRALRLHVPAGGQQRASQAGSSHQGGPALYTSGCSPVLAGALPHAVENTGRPVSGSGGDSAGWQVTSCSPTASRCRLLSTCTCPVTARSPAHRPPTRPCSWPSSQRPWTASQMPQSWRPLTTRLTTFS